MFTLPFKKHWELKKKTQTKSKSFQKIKKKHFFQFWLGIDLDAFLMIGGRIDLAQLMSILQGFMSRIVCQSLCPAPPKLSEWSLECLTVLDHSADLSGRQWTRPLNSTVCESQAALAVGEKPASGS